MRLQSFVLGTCLVVLASAPAGAQLAPSVSSEFFETRIRPVLSSKCYACHSSRACGAQRRARARHQSRRAQGWNAGTGRCARQAGESRLLEALSYANAHLQMPPSGKLADAIIADFERWIAAGAPIRAPTPPSPAPDRAGASWARTSSRWDVSGGRFSPWGNCLPPPSRFPPQSRLSSRSVEPRRWGPSWITSFSRSCRRSGWRLRPRPTPEH